MSGLILIRSDWIATSDTFEFIWIEVLHGIGLRRINFQAFFNKQDSKRFSDWFGLIRIGSDKNIGIFRNSFIYLFIPIL